MLIIVISKTKIDLTRRDNAAENDARRAAAVLNDGGIVAFPTDTSYAIGGNATDASVARRVFAIKRRNADAPMPIFISAIDAIHSVAESVNERSLRLMRFFWPGQLTLILDKKAAISAELTGGRDGVGARMPRHSLALSILKKVNFPVIASSANISGEPPCFSGDAVVESLGDQVDLVLFGECDGLTQPSTVLDARKLPLRLIRQGAARLESVFAV